jgi:hypothetical protein
MGGVAAFALWQWQRSKAEADKAHAFAEEMAEAARLMEQEAVAAREYEQQLRSSAESEALIEELPEDFDADKHEDMLDLSWTVGP